MTDAEAGQTVAITGASGFIGGNALRYLVQQGQPCVTLGRQPVPGVDVPHRPFALGDVPAADTFAGVDCLLHCAWDFSAKSARDIYARNVVGTVNLFRAAVAAGVRRIVFISTMSAYSGTRQLYGRAKLEVERVVDELGGASLRLGLVWGHDAGGMASAVQKLAAMPVVPVFGWSSHQFTVHRDDVDAAIALAVGSPSMTGVFGVANPAPVSVPQLLRGLASMDGGSGAGRLVRIPWQPVYYAMRTAEALRVPVPLRGDSVLGLVHPAPEVPSFPQWTQSGRTFRPFPAAD